MIVMEALSRGRPKKTWREIVEKDCQVHALIREDAMDRSRWMRQIRVCIHGGAVSKQIHRCQ